MTGIIRIGMTEQGVVQKKYSEAMHIPFFKGCTEHKTAVNKLRIYHAYADQLKVGSSGQVIAWRAIFLLCRCYEMNAFEMTLLVLRTSESGAISIIFEQAIHRLSNRIRVVQCAFLTGILDFVYLCFV